MKSTKILDEEIKDLKISSLPTRPTADVSFGGSGFSSADMKAAFDRLPLLLVERFNTLLDDLFGDVSDIRDEIKTGITEEHTLRELFSDIPSGTFASYLSVGESSLISFLETLDMRITALEEKTSLIWSIVSEGEWV